MITKDELIRIFSDIHDPKIMKRLFDEIFTPAEVQDVALRWRLMKMLHQGVPQRRIAEKLGISLCKITRGSKILKKRQSVSKRILDNSTGEKNALRKTSRGPTR
jgi:TrpR family trp operon transcriptional repressor